MMARTHYFATPYGSDRIALLSFDPEDAGEGVAGDRTFVSICGPDGVITEKRIDDGDIVAAAPSPDGSDLWLLTRFGRLVSFASGLELANLAEDVTDQFIGIAWVGGDLMVFGGNNLLRRVRPDDLTAQQVEGLVPRPLPDVSDFQAMVEWATQKRETYALMGTSALHFVAARSHGEVAIVEEGVLSTHVIPGAETTRFADLTRDDEAAIWLTGATDAPRVIRLLPDGTSRIVLRGSASDQAPTSIASWQGRMFLGDESPENGGLYDLTTEGAGRRWPGIPEVVELVPTPERLWIVGAGALNCLADGALAEVPLD